MDNIPIPIPNPVLLVNRSFVTWNIVFLFISFIFIFMVFHILFFSYFKSVCFSVFLAIYSCLVSMLKYLARVAVFSCHCSASYTPVSLACKLFMASFTAFNHVLLILSFIFLTFQQLLFSTWPNRTLSSTGNRSLHLMHCMPFVTRS